MSDFMCVQYHTALINQSILIFYVLGTNTTHDIMEYIVRIHTFDLLSIFNPYSYWPSTCTTVKIVPQWIRCDTSPTHKPTHNNLKGLYGLQSCVCEGRRIWSTAYYDHTIQWVKDNICKTVNKTPWKVYMHGILNDFAKFEPGLNMYDLEPVGLTKCKMPYILQGDYSVNILSI